MQHQTGLQGVLRFFSADFKVYISNVNVILDHMTINEHANVGLPHLIFLTELHITQSSDHYYTIIDSC